MKTAHAAPAPASSGRGACDGRHPAPAGIAAPQTRVYQAVATREGLSGWRTREVGDPGAGGIRQS
jgi:hypothetical protein